MAKKTATKKPTAMWATRYTVWAIDDTGRNKVVTNARTVVEAARRAAKCDPQIDEAVLADTWNWATADCSLRYEIGAD